MNRTIPSQCDHCAEIEESKPYVFEGAPSDYADPPELPLTMRLCDTCFEDYEGAGWTIAGAPNG